MLLLSCALGGFKSSFPHAPPVHEASCLVLMFYHLPALKWEADNTRTSRFWAKTTAILFSGELSSEKPLKALVLTHSPSPAGRGTATVLSRTETPNHVFPHVEEFSVRFGPGKNFFFFFPILESSEKEAWPRQALRRGRQRRRMRRVLQSSSITATSRTLAEGETWLCMEGTEEGESAAPPLSELCFQNHQESRNSPFFEDLTPYRQLRAPGVTVEHVLPSV